MNIETIREVLGWCSVINYGVLVWWFLFFVLAHDWMFRLHRRWFRISKDHFDTVHYGGMAVYKLGIFLFNLVPYLVLRFLV